MREEIPHEDWVQARLGKLTASRFSDAIAKTKQGWSASRRKYMIELIAERLTGQPSVTYLSQPMLWGIESEPNARAAYERKIGETVITTGFVDHPRIPNCGCSPDGLVGYDGLVEIKCPETRTHIAYLMDRDIPAEYKIQMHWQMACTGRMYVDFVSYDSRLPLSASLLIMRVNRDEHLIKELETEAITFLQEMVFAMTRIEEYHLGSEEVLP